MNKTSTLLLLAFSTACAAPKPLGVTDPALETGALAKHRVNQKLRKDAMYLPRVMIELDQAIDRYFDARSKLPDRRAAGLKVSLDKIIRERTRGFFYDLIAMADNPREPGNRGIALVALGFVDDPETKRKDLAKTGAEKKRYKNDRRPGNYIEAALNPLITALSDDDDMIVEKALLGLGVLAANDTPVIEVGAILENTKRPLELRENAAWALALVQPHLTPDRRKRIRPIFQRVLMQPLGEVDPTIVVECLAGLGRFRQAVDAKIVEPYCEHPVPAVRARAAIALGLMRNQSSYKTLLPMIEAKETNLNVRLTARKALMALAGGKDRKYDVKAWEKLFQRK